MGTDLKFPFEEEVAMRQGTNLGSQIGRWIVLAALVALLGALLLTTRPVGAQDPAPIIMDYPENSTKELVGKVRATDPGGEGLNWKTTGDDGEVFDISDMGVLTFKMPPNFESSR